MANSVFNLSSLNGSNGFTISGKAEYDYSGSSVSSAGDINGDGFDDLIIGAYGADPNGSYSGESYVVFGSRSGFGSTLNLSALNGSNGFTISGKTEIDFLGTSVSSAGDINGDGIDDLIIGADRADPNGIVNSGESYVVFGSRSGFGSTLNLSDLNGSNGFTISGKAASDNSGTSVSSAGDINGDGIDDLIIGASGADPNGSYSGESYVVFGSRSGFGSTLNLSDLNGSNGFAISGKFAGDYSGASVSSAGDINGDGIDDLIIGANGADLNGDRSGESYVVFGSRSGFSSILNLSALNGSNGFAIRGKLADDQSGFSVSNAGDINGDGLDDLIIGADGADPNGSRSGESYVVFGSRSGFGSTLNLSDLNGSNGFTIRGRVAFDQSGYSVSSAGDINGDGLDDLIIGANQADPNGINSGESYVVFGSRSGFSSTLNLSDLNGSNGFAISGKVGYDQSGRSVSSAGDINGDGLDDLIIGALGADPNGNLSGESYVMYGNAPSILDLNGANGQVAGFAIRGKTASDLSGYSVSSAGDINGDGIDDLIIGANQADPTTSLGNAGESYVVFGSRSGFNSTLNLSSLNGSNGFTIRGKVLNDNSGRSVSSAGDINGDGLDDLLIGASEADPSGLESGQSYVVFGSRSGFSSTLNLSSLSGTNGFAISGKLAGDNLGRSVSNAGDINGDGLDDLIIGAFGADPTTSLGNAGESYVVFGNRSGFSSSLSVSSLTGSNGFAIIGNGATGNSGRSVSSAGDINGDGLDDLIIGAPGADPTTSLGNAGESYVVFGSRNAFNSTLNLADLNGSNGFMIRGRAAGDFLGRSVSSAGDINGDGLDDLIIGADTADPNGSSSGESYVVFGSRNAFDSTFNLSSLNGSNGFTISGKVASDQSGISVSNAGDINGDGLDDLLIGAIFADPNGSSSGESYVVFGSRNAFDSTFNLSNLNGSNGFAIRGKAASDRLGRSVSSAGDINGDGFDDLIIGAYGANSSTGESYVIFGAAGIGAGGVLELSGLVGSTLDGVNFSTTFTGSSVLVVDTDLTLVDRNSATLVGATITITNLLNGTNESLSAITGATPIAASYNNTNGVLTLSGAATVAQYQQVLRTISYNNTASSIDYTSRVITFVVDDGAAFANTSAIATTTLAIVNPAPVITSAASASFAENGTGVAYTITATDASPITYGLTGLDASLFSVNTSTGAIRFNTAPNFEAPADNGGNNVYDINVTANDGNSTGSLAVAISVTNLGEFNGTGTRLTINGTASDDYIVGGSGAKQLIGGAGNDQFVYNSTRDVGQRINDFTVGEDKIVLTGLLASIGYVGSNPIDDGFIRFVDNTGVGGGSFLQLDRDGTLGTAIFRNFVQVDIITPVALNNVNNFIF